VAHAGGTGLAEARGARPASEAWLTPSHPDRAPLPSAGAIYALWPAERMPTHFDAARAAAATPEKDDAEAVDHRGGEGRSPVIGAATPDRARGRPAPSASPMGARTTPIPGILAGAEGVGSGALVAGGSADAAPAGGAMPPTEGEGNSIAPASGALSPTPQLLLPGAAARAAAANGRGDASAASFAGNAVSAAAAGAGGSLRLAGGDRDTVRPADIVDSPAAPVPADTASDGAAMAPATAPVSSEAADPAAVAADVAPSGIPPLAAQPAGPSSTISKPDARSFAGADDEGTSTADRAAGPDARPRPGAVEPVEVTGAAPTDAPRRDEAPAIREEGAAPLPPPAADPRAAQASAEPETAPPRTAAAPPADAAGAASPDGRNPADQTPAPSAPGPAAPVGTALAPPETAPSDDLASRTAPASKADEPAAAAVQPAPPTAAPAPTRAEDLSPPAPIVVTPGASTEVAASPPGAPQGSASRRDAVPGGEPPPARNASPAQPGAGVPVARPAAPEPQSKTAAAKAEEAERRAPAAVSIPPALVEALVARGDAMVARRDISAARLLYERAAAAGDARAASALARTYDPAFLAEIGARGINGDAALATAWYRRAISLGDSSALARVEALSGPDRVGQGRP
jgi:hypothetical protein